MSHVWPRSLPTPAHPNGCTPASPPPRRQRGSRSSKRRACARGSADGAPCARAARLRSEEHTSELQSPFLISYAVFCLKKKNKDTDSGRVFELITGLISKKKKEII